MENNIILRPHPNFKFDYDKERQYNCRSTKPIAAQQSQLPLNPANCHSTQQRTWIWI